MANKVRTFKNELFGQVRIVTDENGEPWFVGKDVAAVLGYTNGPKAIHDHVEEEDKLTERIVISGQIRLVYVINESGLYSLILSSKLPQAKDFKRWVTSEVLPQIRKTGGYIPVKEEDDEKTILAKAVGILKRTLEQKEALIAAKDDIISIQQESIEVNRPKVQFADAVTNSEDSILIRDLAKLIASNGIEMGQTRLFGWMREHGYLFLNETRPIQKWVDKGLFVLDETVYDDGRRIRLNTTTRVTGKGQEYFVNGFVSGKFYLKK